MAKIVITTRPMYRAPRLMMALNLLLAIAGFVAIASLVLQYGGFRPGVMPVSHEVLKRIQRIVVALFILDRLARVVLARQRREYLRQNWLDLALIGLFAVAMVWNYGYNHNVLSAGALYVIITQVYLMAILILRGISAHLRLASSGLPPSWLLIGSFGVLCLVGSGLLMLPVSVRPEFYARWFYPEALFTAVSATCVTGLVVVDTGTHFTAFGQAVILVLIQLGGLGIMIFGTMLAMLAGKALSFRGSDTLGEILAENRLNRIGPLVRFIVLVTLLLEGIGALLLIRMFYGAPDAWGKALNYPGAVWYAVFHSVSAFCNAGFALYGNNMMQGVGEGWSVPLREHWQVMGVIAPLIIFGGLGFPVLDDMQRYFRTWVQRLRRRKKVPDLTRPMPQLRVSLHSRIVLVTTLILILGGAAGLLLVEQRIGPHWKQETYASSEWRGLDGWRKVREALFQSITARTAGFNTIGMDELSESGKLWMCGLMTVGGSPASTAGGMKTVTLAMMILSAWCLIRKRQHLEVFHRSLPYILLHRVVTLIVLYVGLVIMITILLCMSMPGEEFIDLLFEACSACGTVGLSTGVTNRLGMFGEFVIIVGMFIGRVGPLTLILAMSAAVNPARYRYPNENVLIG